MADLGDVGIFLKHISDIDRNFAEETSSSLINYFKEKICNSSIDEIGKFFAALSRSNKSFATKVARELIEPIKERVMREDKPERMKKLFLDEKQGYESMSWFACRLLNTLKQLLYKKGLHLLYHDLKSLKFNCRSDALFEPKRKTKKKKT